MKQLRKLSQNERMTLKFENLLNEISLYTGLTQEEIADALGMSRTTLWLRKKSPQELCIQDLRRLCTLVDKDFSVFISDFVK